MTYADVVTADAPVAWWRGNGTTADEIAGGTAGVLTGGATYGAGVLPIAPTRQSFSLDGVDDYVSVADQAKLDLTGDMTLECWIVPNSIGAVGNSRALFTKGISTTSNIYGLQFTDGKLEMRTRGSDGVSIRSTAPSQAVVGQTYHVVGTVSGTTQRLYVNGVLVASTTTNGPLIANAQPLRIGTFNGTSEFFNGRISEVAVYNRALSAAEVTEHYDAGQVVAPPADPPTANAGADLAGVEPYTLVTLEGEDSGDLGTVDIRQWAQTAGPTVTLVNANTATATFEAGGALTPITYTFSYTVTDNSTGLSATDSVSVTTLPVSERISVSGTKVPAKVRVI